MLGEWNSYLEFLAFCELKKFSNTLYLLIETDILQKIAIWFPVLTLMVN